MTTKKQAVKRTGTAKPTLLRSISRGMSTVVVGDGQNLRRQAALSKLRSTKRMERSWLRVGSALRDELGTFQSEALNR